MNYLGVHVIAEHCKLYASATSTTPLTELDTYTVLAGSSAPNYAVYFWVEPDPGYSFDVSMLVTRTDGGRLRMYLDSNRMTDTTTYSTFYDTPLWYLGPCSVPYYNHQQAYSIGGANYNCYDETYGRWRFYFGAHGTNSTNVPTDPNDIPPYASDSSYYYVIKVLPQIASVTTYTATAGTVSGCTLYGTGTFDSGDTVNLTAGKLDDSYEDPIITIKDSDGNVLQSGASPQSITITEDLVIDAIAAPKTVVNVTQNLTHCTSSWSAATAYQGDTLSATFTADNDYQMSAVTAEINGSVVASGVDSISVQLTGDVTITATATAIPTAAITQSLTNCTSDLVIQSAQVGTTINVSFTANTGYQMSACSAEISGSVVASGTDSLSFTLTDDVTITATAVLVPTATITQNLTNCTSNISALSGNVGDTITATFTPINGYQMDSCSAEISGSVVASGVDSLSFTLTDDVVITATAVQAAGLTITESLGGHVTSDFVGGTVASGTTVTIHYTPSQGYDIATYSCVYTGTETDYTINDTYDSQTGILTIEVTVTADITIEVTEVAEDTSIANSFVNVYLPTDAELRTLAHDRFRSYVSSKSYDGTTFTSLEDKARSVLALYKTFFPITPVPNDTYRVYYGYYGTAVYTECAFYDKETLDCGTVAVAEITHDALDYQCVASIYLPFIGMRTIDIKQIMGQSVNLKYEFNVYDGSCLACLSNNAGMFQTEAGYIREDIPYVLRENAGSLVMNSYYALDKTPYILIQHDRVSNSNNTFGRRTDVTAVVSSLSGYNVIDEINLPNNARMSENEYNVILMRLKTGVII